MQRLVALSVAFPVALMAGVTTAPAGFACPITVSTAPLGEQARLYQVYRYLPHSETHTLAPATHPARPRGRWQQVPWQLVNRAAAKGPASHGLLRSRDLGATAPAHEPPPCPQPAQRAKDQAGSGFQLRAFVGHDMRSLYWFACPPTALPSPVRPARQEVMTPSYYYRYEGQNKLLFSTLGLSKAGSQGSFQKVAIAANQQLLGNFKNFFTMTFDTSDFRVNDLLSQTGPVGVYSKLNFLLKVLGMKIDLDLVTEVYFYPEGMYTPMILHMPLDAKTYLKRGSGVVYSWQQLPGFRWQPARKGPGGPSAIGGVPTVAEGLSPEAVVAKYCQGRCFFSIKGISDEDPSRQVYLHFRLPRYLVALGFYPVYFAQEAELHKALGYKISTSRGEARKPSKGVRRSGFFFESARLPKGEHRWDLAIDTRQPAQLRPLPCGELRRLVPLRP